MTNEDEIRRVAYALWEEEGRPEGKDVEHYLRAKKLMEEREAKRIIELAPVPLPVELASPTKHLSLPPTTDKRSIRERHKKK